MSLLATGEAVDVAERFSGPARLAARVDVELDFFAGIFFSVCIPSLLLPSIASQVSKFISLYLFLSLSIRMYVCMCVYVHRRGREVRGIEAGEACRIGSTISAHLL